MEELTSMGIISIIPAILAIVLSFATKNTIVALAVACIAGTTMSGIVMGDSLVDTLLLGLSHPAEGKPGHHQLLLGHAAEHPHRHSGGLFPEDRRHSGLLPVGPRQAPVPPGRAAHRLGAGHVCLFQRLLQPPVRGLHHAQHHRPRPASPGRSWPTSPTPPLPL